MKRTIFIYLSLILACQTGICQNRMLQNLGHVKSETALPYKFCEKEVLTEPLVAFPIDLVVNTSFKNRVWTDLALTQEETMKIDLSNGDIWPICEIGCKFITINTNFNLFSVVFGPDDYIKHSLVTIDKNGNYIDSIEIGAEIVCSGWDYYYPMKWEITEDLTVKTYQLKPTSSTPILYNSDIPDTLQAQRIDRTYSIDSNGEFSEVETKYYEPRNYSKDKFLNKSYDISTGNEIYINPIKIEPAPSVFDN